MPVLKITKRAVDLPETHDKAYVACDNTLVGFGVWVNPTGMKSFINEYQPGSGGRRAAKKRLAILPIRKNNMRASSQYSP